MPIPEGATDHKIEIFVDPDGKIKTMDPSGKIEELIVRGNVWREVIETVYGQTIVLFDNIPQNLQVLELCWGAYIEGGSEAMLCCRFGSNIEDLSNETFWHVHRNYPDGTSTTYKDDTSPFDTDAAMPLGIVNHYGPGGQSSGRTQFTSYAQMDGEFGRYGSITSHGNGQSVDSGYTPSIFTAGAWFQGSGPIDRLALRAYDLSDASGIEQDWLPDDPDNTLEFHENSRFILTGFKG